MRLETAVSQVKRHCTFKAPWIAVTVYCKFGRRRENRNNIYIYICNTSTRKANRKRDANK